MQIFRKHTVQWVMSIMLTIGMAAHLAIPGSTKAQKNAFTQWLDRNVVDSGEESESFIRTHIQQLPTQNENFPLLLEQATRLVLDHKSDFKLPIQQKNEETGDFGLWLIGKWSQHQSATGAMDALLPDLLKPGLKWLNQNNPFPEALHSGAESLLPTLPEIGSVEHALFVIQNRPIPFLSGVSINAP